MCGTLRYRACLLMMLVYSHHIDSCSEWTWLALLGNPVQAQHCIVARNLLHGLNSCWKRPTCRPHVNTEGWEFLIPHCCGPSVRQAVTNVCTSGWCTWKTYETWLQLCALHMGGFDCPLDLTHTVIGDKAVKQYYIGLFLLAHKVNLLYKAFLAICQDFKLLYMSILCVYTFLLS